MSKEIKNRKSSTKSMINRGNKNNKSNSTSSSNKNSSSKNSFNKANSGKSASKNFSKKNSDFKKSNNKLKKNIEKNKSEKINEDNSSTRLASYNWYPGHMTKAKRQMQEDIKLIDLVIEIVDSRVPESSRNPDIDDLATNKARIIILNKSDLADDKVTNTWISHYKEKNFYCVKMDSRKNNGFKALNDIIYEACKDKIKKDQAKGLINRPIRAMVVGIPNVGKSTFINAYSGKASAKTGNKPGVTKGKQWIKLKDNIELLDTPGILWPRFEDQTTGLRLAMIGSINDNILNKDELALEIIKYLNEYYPQDLQARYDLNNDELTAINTDSKLMIDSKTSYALGIMDIVAMKRGCLKKGGVSDYEKVANIILDDFRSGRLGKVSLERP